MSIDLSPILQALLGLAAAVVTGAVPFVVPLIRQRMHIAISADMEQRLDRALNAAAGIAYKLASESIDKGGLSNVSVHSQALARATQYVATHVPDTMATLGVTQDNVRDMVSARLGSLLATDPTVSAGSPGATKAM